VRDRAPYVCLHLDAKISSFEITANNVVSRARRGLRNTAREQRDEFLVNLNPERFWGTVSSVVNFGAFVDLV